MSAGNEAADVEPEGAPRPADLPAATAPSLLLTTLAEFVLPSNEPVWTASLLYVMTGLGIDERAARQAISRAADAGWLDAERHGRTVRWTVTSDGAQMINDISRRATALGAPRDEWSGDWVIVTVTIPQRHRAVRDRLYRVLRCAGFGSPTPGLWVSPNVERAEKIKDILDELGLQDSTMSFTGQAVAIGLDEAKIVRLAWDLDEIADRYEKLIATFEHCRPAAGDDVLFTHVSLVNEWREFPLLDPQLPEALLPDWVGRRATEMSRLRYKKWATPARERWREIVRLTASRVTSGIDAGEVAEPAK